MVIPYVIIGIGYEGGTTMAKMGRPKTEDPVSKVITFKVKETEYQAMLEYTKSHNISISISQLIRMGIKMKMNESRK